MTVETAVPKTLTAHEHPVREIFSDRFFFEIPDYQRPYSWTTEQSGDLLDDLLDAMRSEKGLTDNLNPYFLGSIVLIKGRTARAEIVDGQQRLTTLTILISAIRSLVVPDRQRFLSQVLYQQGDPFSEIEDRFRLTLRKRDAEFFQENVQREGGLERLRELTDNLTDSQQRILTNALHLHEKLKDLEESQLETLARFILTRCYLVAVSTPDLDSAYRIFSVLNDRGLELSHADILKAEVVGATQEPSRSTYAGKWEGIEEELGREAFQNLFGHIRMIFRKAKAQGTLLEEFRAHVKPKENSTNFIDNTLRPFARAYGEIIGACYEGTSRVDEINAVAENLLLIDNNDWIPPAIKFLSLYRKEPDLLLRHLQELERLAAGTMIIRTNFNWRMERYGRLLRMLEAGKNLFEEDSPLQLTPKERAKAVEILNGDIYNTRIRIPILLRLDRKLSDEGAVYTRHITTVEHVLPQNPSEDSVWLRNFPDEEERARLTHQLGNLVLLSRRKNGQAQNWDFDRKKLEYFQRGSVSTFALTSQVLSEENWTPEVIRGRQQRLVSTLKDIWRL